MLSRCPRHSFTELRVPFSIVASAVRVLRPGMTLRKECTSARRPINLLLGWPNPDLLPPKHLQTAATNVLLDTRDAVTPVLEYGDDPGYLPLRKEIAVWLTQFYAPRDPISHHRICISGGASQNLACLLQTFTDPIYTRNVFMVAPTYYLACRIFADAGFDGRLKGVPEDEEGIDLDFLEDALRMAENAAVSNGNTEPVSNIRRCAIVAIESDPALA